MGTETSPVAFAWQDMSQAGTEPEQHESSAASFAAEYYEQPPPASQQQALLAYSPSPQATFYYGGNYLPWTSFMGTFPESYPLFWASTQGGWSWYAALPAGAWVQELMYVPVTGILKVIEIYPDGTTQMHNFGPAAQGYRYIWFNGDVPGRHITLFTVGEMTSNAVAIDVGYMLGGYPQNGYLQDGYPPGSSYPLDATYASDTTVVYSSETSQSSSVNVDRDILSGNTVTGNTMSGTIYPGSFQPPDSSIPFGQQGQMGKPGKGLNAVVKPSNIPALGR